MKIDILHNAPNTAVRLLRPVRASNGQEFLSGWVAGFSPESAKYLVEAGFAMWPGDGLTARLDAPVPYVSVDAQVEPQTAPVTRAPISHGDTADAPATTEATHTLLPSRRRRG
jgi:hypothetical protein